MEMIQVTDLVKRYGDVEALRKVSFTVSPGEVIGLLGPNAAGKTTIMKILTGFIQPDEGTVRVNGLDGLTALNAVQAMIGYLPENAPVYPELTVQSYLQMIAALRGIPVEKQREMIAEAIRAVGLEDRLTRPISTLSKGYRQRVGLAQAIVHQPKLLILDEPTSGLDPTQIVEVRKLIRKLAEKTTVLFSTHILSEVEATCDRAIIIMQGQVRADACLSELAATHSLLLTLSQPLDIEAVLSAIPGVLAVKRQSAGDEVVYRIDAENEVDLRASLFQRAAKENWPVLELRRDARTLETVFNELALSGEKA